MGRQAYSISRIAHEIGATYHQVAHAIRQLKIEPLAGVEGAKLYGLASKKRIGKWLKSNARRKLSGAAASDAATG